MRFHTKKICVNLGPSLLNMLVNIHRMLVNIFKTDQKWPLQNMKKLKITIKPLFQNIVTFMLIYDEPSSIKRRLSEALACSSEERSQRVEKKEGREERGNPSIPPLAAFFWMSRNAPPQELGERCVTSKKRLRGRLQHPTPRCFLWSHLFAPSPQSVVCYTAVFSVVTQRSSTLKTAVCLADYANSTPGTSFRNPVRVTKSPR